MCLKQSPIPGSNFFEPAPNVSMEDVMVPDMEPPPPGDDILEVEIEGDTNEKAAEAAATVLSKKNIKPEAMEVKAEVIIDKEAWVEEEEIIIDEEEAKQPEEEKAAEASPGCVESDTRPGTGLVSLCSPGPSPKEVTKNSNEYKILPILVQQSNWWAEQKSKRKNKVRPAFCSFNSTYSTTVSSDV